MTKPEREHWWRPVVDYYGPVYIFQWETYWEGNHITFAKSPEQALQMLHGVLRWTKKEREGIPNLVQAIEGRAVYPPRVYFEAYTAQQARDELRSYQIDIRCALIRLVEAGEPLPEGFKACPGVKEGEDGWVSHYRLEDGTDCGCGGNEFFHDWEKSFNEGGRERMRAKGRYKAAKPYDSTEPHVQHYQPDGDQLFGVTPNGTKGMGIDTIDKFELRKYRHRPAYVPPYALFVQGRQVRATHLESILAELRATDKAKRDQEKRLEEERQERRRLETIEEARRLLFDK